MGSREAGGISTQMQTARQALERLLELIEGQAGLHQPRGAETRAALLRAGLHHYLALEEKLLAPLLERMEPSARTLRVERARRHHLLHEHLAQLERALHVDFPFALIEAVTELRDVLQREHGECRAHLHARLDAVLPSEDREALSRTLREGRVPSGNPG